MPNVPLDLLTPGMTTTADVVNQRGQILVPQGSPITDRHLRGLKMWGIDSVEIDAADVGDAIYIPPSLDIALPTDDERKQYLALLFRHNQTETHHPFWAALYQLCDEHLSKNGLPTTAFIKHKSPRTDATNDNATNSSTQKKLASAAEMIKNSSNLASPPDIYAKLMEVMDRSGSSSSNIAGVIANDPGLSARLLKIVNSAYYSFPTPIETISRAITIVGTDELRHMVLVTSIIKNFSASLDSFLDMEQFWRHSIACALFSKQLAKLRNDQNAERFFTTGLLHDIGRLIMYLQMPDTMAALLSDNDENKHVDAYQVERTRIGVTHTQVGGELADSWKLSTRQKEAIQFHHRPEGAKRFPVDTAILHISDVLANALQIGSSGSTYIPKCSLTAWEKIHLPENILARVAQEVQREVTDLINIFYEKSNDRN